MQTPHEIRPVPRRSRSPLGLASRLAALAAVVLVIAACGQAVTPPVDDELTLTSISPTTGTSATLVTGSGTNIAGNASVTVGGEAATVVAVKDADGNEVTGDAKTGTSIEFNPPTLAPGEYDVTVSQGTGATAESATLAGVFTYEDVDVEPGDLTITSISPNQGLSTTLVTVTGQYIAGDATVTVGGEAATVVAVFDAANNDITGEDVKTGTRITFNPPELTLGEVYDVTVSQGADEDAESATLEGAFTYDEEVVVVPGDALYYINAGGPEVEAGGVTWESDIAYVFATGGTFSNAVPIAETDMDVIYQSERHTTGGQPTFSYHIPVAEAGTYLVVLHFAEIYYGFPGGGAGLEGPGSRVFNVTLEGEAVLTNYDLYVEAGNAVGVAVVHEEFVEVTDGTLNVAVTNVAGGGKLSAIEVHAPAAAAD